MQRAMTAYEQALDVAFGGRRLSKEGPSRRNPKKPKKKKLKKRMKNPGENYYSRFLDSEEKRKSRSRSRSKKNVGWSKSIMISGGEPKQ